LKSHGKARETSRAGTTYEETSWRGTGRLSLSLSLGRRLLQIAASSCGEIRVYIYERWIMRAVPRDEERDVSRREREREREREKGGERSLYPY
jgi:hypothetical protein